MRGARRCGQYHCARLGRKWDYDGGERGLRSSEDVCFWSTVILQEELVNAEEYFVLLSVDLIERGVDIYESRGKTLV